MVIKKCEICGEEFEARDGRQIYCSPECAGKVPFDGIKKRRESKKEKVKNGGRIIEYNTKARQLGMSYGQYVAMLYQEGETQRMTV